jgi:hypothetical protein
VHSRGLPYLTHSRFSIKRYPTIHYRSLSVWPRSQKLQINAFILIAIRVIFIFRQIYAHSLERPLAHSDTLL